MVYNMHCRTSCSPTKSPYSSSFLFVASDYTNALNRCAYSSSSYHDHISPPPPPLPARRCRRRLEDPIITYASNYYAIYSHPTLHSPPPSPQSPSLPSHHRIYQTPNDKDIFCDLYNLLERPPPAKQRRKYNFSDYNLRCRHRSMDYKNTHAKVKTDHDQKHPNQQPQPSYYHDRKSLNNQRSFTQQYDQSEVKNPNNIRLYPRHSSSKGFLRRVACNYLCMPMIDTDEEISS